MATNQSVALMTNRIQKEGVKLAILIGNSTYANLTDWPDLQGVKQDLEAMKAKLSGNGYRVEVIKNSVDMLADIEDVMKNTAESSVTHLQVVYLGEEAIIYVACLDGRRYKFDGWEWMAYGWPMG